MNTMQHKAEDSTLTLERTFDAPRQKVWDAFTKPELFIQWWGPQGWTTEVKEFDFSEGGVNHYGMKCVDKEQGEWYGKYSWGKMVYSNIRPIEGFENVDYFVDENAVVQENMPASKTAMAFTEVDGQTKIVSVTEYTTPEALKTVLDMGMLEGIAQTWDRLEELVASDS